jgi:hypothetical protein
MTEGLRRFCRPRYGHSGWGRFTACKVLVEALWRRLPGLANTARPGAPCDKTARSGAPGTEPRTASGARRGRSFSFFYSGCASGVASRWLVHPLQDGAYSEVAAGETISLLPSGPGRKEARAPRRPHRRRWHPSSPMPAPRRYQRIPVSKIRPCAPWSRCTARR